MTRLGKSGYRTCAENSCHFLSGLVFDSTIYPQKGNRVVFLSTVIDLSAAEIFKISVLHGSIEVNFKSVLNKLTVEAISAL